MKDSGVDSHLPLAPAALHILLALAGEPMHGYGIMREVDRQTGGRYKLGPGTLYDNLQKLTRQKLVEETSAPGEDDDPRRRYFRLTRLGTRVLAAEVDRLEGVVLEARLRTPKMRRAR